MLLNVIDTDGNTHTINLEYVLRSTARHEDKVLELYFTTGDYITIEGAAASWIKQIEELKIIDEDDE